MKLYKLTTELIGTKKELKAINRIIKKQNKQKYKDSIIVFFGTFK